MEVIKVPSGFEIPGLNMKIVKTPQGYKIEGSPFQVKLGSFACPGTIGNYSVTGIPFKPRLVEFQAGRPSTPSSFAMGIGRMDYEGNQHTISWCGMDDVQKGKMSDVRCIQVIDLDNSYAIIGIYVSMNDDGFTINFTDVDTDFLIFWKATG